MNIRKEAILIEKKKRKNQLPNMQSFAYDNCKKRELIDDLGYFWFNVHYLKITILIV